jgi:hypothetical protein
MTERDQGAPMLAGEESVSLRAAVVDAGARWSARQHELVRAIAALDSSREWLEDGAPTCAHWVARALDIEVSTAREWLRIGHALEILPLIDRAFASGRMSYSKVRAITRVATPDTQEELCELAGRVPAAAVRGALADWQAKRETPEQTEARHQAARSLVSRLDVDGMVVGSYRLPPAEAAVLHASIDGHVRARRRGASADAWPSLCQQRADGLVALARGRTAVVTTEVIVHVRGDGCTLDDGTPIPGTVVERIAPDAFLRAMIHDADRNPINVSGRHRHPTRRQRRLVKERDRACVDCGTTDYLDCDHVPPFDESRRTIVDELELRCWNCHHRRHRGNT